MRTILAVLAADRRTHTWATRVFRTMATVAAFAATFRSTFATVLASFAPPLVLALFAHAATLKAASAAV
jgi:hypothetical protein